MDIILRYLGALGDNDHLSLRALSKKLALLMALTDASRTSELQALDLRFRRFRPEGVYFTLAALTKKQKVGAPAKGLFFGALFWSSFLELFWSVSSRPHIVCCAMLKAV